MVAAKSVARRYSFQLFSAWAEPFEVQSRYSDKMWKHTKSKVMDSKDTRREEIRREHGLPEEEARRLRADGKVRHNNSTRKVNRLWLWLGVLILVFILLWWLYSIGTFEALTGVANG